MKKISPNIFNLIKPLLKYYFGQVKHVVSLRYILLLLLSICIWLVPAIPIADLIYGDRKYPTRVIELVSFFWGPIVMTLSLLRFHLSYENDNSQDVMGLDPIVARFSYQLKVLAVATPILPIVVIVLPLSFAITAFVSNQLGYWGFYVGIYQSVQILIVFPFLLSISPVWFFCTNRPKSTEYSLLVAFFSIAPLYAVLAILAFF